MKSKFFLQLIIYCFAIFVNEAALAQTPEAEVQNWAQARGEELLDALKENNIPEKYKMLDELYGKYVDSDFIAQFVMGKYWRTMNQTEQEQFKRLFHRYALALYKTYPLDFGNNISFRITQTILQENKAIVYAQIHQKNVNPENAIQDILVEFSIRKEGKNLKLVDIKIAESSLSLAYRNKFYKMMVEDDGEVSWFLEDFEILVRSIEAKNYKKLEQFQNYSDIPQ